MLRSFTVVGAALSVLTFQSYAAPKRMPAAAAGEVRAGIVCSEEANDEDAIRTLNYRLTGNHCSDPENKPCVFAEAIGPGPNPNNGLMVYPNHILLPIEVSGFSINKTQNNRYRACVAVTKK